MGLWVSLGYRSKDGEQHSLHIVGGEETTIEPVNENLVPDQLFSCYAAADTIRVTVNSVILTLNKNGRDSLHLPKTVEFVAEKPGRDLEKARAVFTRMKKHHGGKVIHVA
jgi:hypothetical protein